jgi:2-polyprenyl-3-methyl-5-hydroxy-6-metoxy-1,4-benzoquinol methylase
MTTNVQHDYDELWKDSNVLGIPNPKILEFIEEGTPKTILDVGAGNGRYAICLQRKGYEVTVIESSKEGCLKISEQNKDIKIINSDFIDLEIKGGYDAVLLMGIIEDFTEEETQLKILTKAQSLVSVGGRLHIGTAIFIGGRIPENRVDPNFLIKNFDTCKWEIIHYHTDTEVVVSTNKINYNDDNRLKKQLIIAKRISLS